MKTLFFFLVFSVTAWAGAPIKDLRVSGSSTLSGTVTLLSGATLVSASGSAVDLSLSTVTFGTNQIPFSAVGKTVFVGDSGSGGAIGFVPAPGAGDAAAGKFLAASGSWRAITTGDLPEIEFEDLPSIELGDLSDVTITSATAGNVLTYSGSNWTNTEVLVTGLADPTTTPGDLIVRGTSAVVRVPVGTHGQVLVSDTSQATGVRWNAPAVAVVSRSGTQSISNSTLTTLLFNTEIHDPLDLHSTSSNTGRITVDRAGVYVVVLNVQFDGSVSGDRGIYLQKNGSTRIAGNYFAGSATEFSCSTVVVLAAGDYVEGLAFQNSGAALNVLASGERSPKLSVLQIGF